MKTRWRQRVFLRSGDRVGPSIAPPGAAADTVRLLVSDSRDQRRRAQSRYPPPPSKRDLRLV